ncbi:MAG: AAA family ATPase, partial [Anaerolineales bacterium]
QAVGTKFIVIDNLMTISGGKDENSPEIAPAMNGLRALAERTGAAVVVIHHARKQNGIRGGLGDDLRGHSSIRGAIDLALLVEREEGADSVTVKSTKTRDVDVEPFGALFTYTHKPGTYDLETAAFFGQKVIGAETTAEIEQAIIAVLQAAGRPLSQTDLVKAVKSEGIQAGVNRIRDIAARMANSLRLKTQTGNRGAILYHV